LHGHEDGAIAVHKSRKSVINKQNTGSGIIEHKSAAARSVDTAFKEVETNSTRTNLKPTKNVVRKGVTRARAKAEAKKCIPIRQEEITKVHVKQLPKKQAPKRRSQQGRTTRPQNFGHAGRKVASSGLESNDDEETLQWSFVWPKWNFNPFGNVRDTTSNIRNTALRVSDDNHDDHVLEQGFDRRRKHGHEDAAIAVHKSRKSVIKRSAARSADTAFKEVETNSTRTNLKPTKNVVPKGKSEPSGSWQSTTSNKVNVKNVGKSQAKKLWSKQSKATRSSGKVYVAPSTGNGSVVGINLGVTDDEEVIKTSDIVSEHLGNIGDSLIDFKNWLTRRPLRDAEVDEDEE